MIVAESTSSTGEDAGTLAMDLTALLDILFILLVFFMLTAGTVLQSLDLTLPSSVAEELPVLEPKKHLMLEIREQTYGLDGQEFLNIQDLKRAVTSTIEGKPGHDLIIAADKAVAIERLLKVLTFLQSQGIDAANILMQEETEQ